MKYRFKENFWGRQQLQILVTNLNDDIGPVDTKMWMWADRWQADEMARDLHELTKTNPATCENESRR